MGKRKVFFDKEQLDSEVWVIYGVLSEEKSDMATALIAASYLEAWLEILIRYALKKCKETDELFNSDSLLGAFGNKIRMAYCTSIINDSAYRNLTIIRKIRNEFAHSRKEKSFSDSKIASYCASLDWQAFPGEIGAIVSKQVANRTRFIVTVVAIMNHLRIFCTDIEATKDKRIIIDDDGYGVAIGPI